MDKFMMFARRFLRQIFKYIASESWEESLASKLSDIFRAHLILCPASDSTLAFQMHFTDIFLEELAKVGGEKLEQRILAKFVEPFLQALDGTVEERLRKHIVERIFKHLLRQSDPGIEWEMGEDDGDELNGEPGSDEDSNDEDMEDAEENGDGGMDVPDENGVDGPLDPRAGKVDVVIPQLSVDYEALSQKFFTLGSKDGLKKSCREDLFLLSKMFKDVSGGVFPLGPNIDENDFDIEKISVKKATANLMKDEQKMLKINR